MEPIHYIAVLVPVLLLLIVLKRRRKTENLPPGPRRLPIIGNFHQLADGTLPPILFHRLSLKYGPLIYLKLGSRHVVVANSSETAEQVLKSQDLNFCSRPLTIATKKLSYGGSDVAFTPYGDYWRDARKMLVLHLLSATRVKSFGHIREGEIQRLVEKISQHASRSEPVNLTERIVYLTSMLISQTAFGKRYELGTGESNEFADSITEFQNVLGGFYVTDFFPWLWCVDWALGKIDHLDTVFKRWDSFYSKLIDEHLQSNRPKSMDGDILDILLQLREASDMPLDHIKALLMNIYFAATDTISTTTIWIMTELMRHPSTMDKVKTEIRSVMGEKKHMLTEEDMVGAELPYLMAVIKEGMRLHSTVPLLVPRETTTECSINGFLIPAKTIVHVNIWALSRDVDLWEKPEEFIPERFLNNTTFNLDIRGNDFGFIPFGGGRRGCPGVAMATVTLDLVLANMIYLFDWEVPEGMKKEDIDTDAVCSIVMHKKNPLWLVPKKYHY